MKNSLGQIKLLAQGGTVGNNSTAGNASSIPCTRIIEGSEVHINAKGKKTRKPRTIYSSQQLQALNHRQRKLH